MVQLYGGALTCEVPLEYVDARQIPDNQEVFVTMQDAETSIIFEILEMEDCTNDEAPNVHFDALAHDNEATSTMVISTTALEQDLSICKVDLNAKVYSLYGVQKIVKFGQKDKLPEEVVHILLGIIRLPLFQADITVCLNIPATSGLEQSLEKARTDMDSMLNSLQIVDKTIFA